MCTKAAFEEYMCDFKKHTFWICARLRLIALGLHQIALVVAHVFLR